jgi:D-threo-aldose 1-dehydrogenase
MSLPARPLGATGLEVTVLGAGTAPLAGLFEPVPPGTAAAVLDAAWEDGVRFFDTAPFYGFGAGERRTGDALRPRDGFVLSTKVGRLLVPDAGVEGGDWADPLPFRPVPDYSEAAVRRSFEDSLQRLGLDRVDMLFLHDIGEMTHGAAHPAHFEDAMTGGLAALRALKAEGLIRAYGIGVNETAVLEAALERGDWDVFLLAGRYTLLEQDALDRLMPACEARGTAIVCGGPYNSGLLAGGGTWNYDAAPPEIVARRDRLAALCREHGVALEAAALQFPLGHPIVASVIPGARSVEEARANAAHMTARIPPELWPALVEAGLLRPDAPLPG